MILFYVSIKPFVVHFVMSLAVEANNWSYSRYTCHVQIGLLRNWQYHRIIP